MHCSQPSRLQSAESPATTTLPMESRMPARELLLHATERLAIGMMLLTILGTAGCMIWQPTGGVAVDVASPTDPTIDQANGATDKCEAFACAR